MIGELVMSATAGARMSATGGARSVTEIRLRPYGRTPPLLRRSGVVGDLRTSVPADRSRSPVQRSDPGAIRNLVLTLKELITDSRGGGPVNANVAARSDLARRLSR
jgi:hypothetical protein